MPHSVFLSYARRDSRSHAEALWRALQGTEADAFLDSEDIEQGTTFPKILTEAVLDARVFVLFADRVYFTRWYCLRELRLALAGFEAFVERGATAEERQAALTHVVVALSPDGVNDADLKRLPPAVTQVSWPRANDTEALARLVTERLSQAVRTLRKGCEAARVPPQRLAVMVAEAEIPPAGNLSAIPVYPLDIPPSLHGDFIGRANKLWQLDYHLSTPSGARLSHPSVRKDLVEPGEASGSV